MKLIYWTEWNKNIFLNRETDFISSSCLIIFFRHKKNNNLIIFFCMVRKFNKTKESEHFFLCSWSSKYMIAILVSCIVFFRIMHFKNYSYSYVNSKPNFVAMVVCFWGVHTRSSVCVWFICVWGGERRNFLTVIIKAILRWETYNRYVIQDNLNPLFSKKIKSLNFA